MEKYRVYELAKELNTTSKRLMEKLAEINIIVKNHMSLLDDKELNALYDHIGIIKHDGSARSDAEDKRPASFAPPKPEPRKDVGQTPAQAKDVRHAPRIIRTTEIIIDTKHEARDMKTPIRPEQRAEVRGDVRGNVKAPQKHDLIRVADANSGLRMGFMRETKPDYRRDIPQTARTDKPREQVKEQVKPEQKREFKPEDRQPQKPVDKAPEARNEAAVAVPKDTHIHEKELEKAVQAKPVTEVERQAEKPTEAPVEKPAAERPLEQRSAEKAAEQRTAPKAERQPAEQRNATREDRERQKEARPEKHQRPADQAFSRSFVQDRAARKPEGQQEQKNFQKDRYPRQGQNQGPGQRDQGPFQHKGGFKHTGQPQGGPGSRGQTYGGQNAGQAQGRPPRQQGDRPPRPQGDRPRPMQKPLAKPLEIPKAELTDAQREEMNSQRSELRREFQGRDTDKDFKRDQKKEASKTQGLEKGRRFTPPKIVLGEKKGVSEVLSEEFILNEFYEDDDVKKARKLQNRKKDGKEGHEGGRFAQKKPVMTSVTLPENITVKDLAEILKKTSNEVIKKLMELGPMVTLNQVIDFDTAAIVAEEYGIKADKEIVVSEEDILFDDAEDKEGELVPRPPVVVVMGHVDHGKTSLLDAIKKTNVIESEAGGITQHIGAYTVKINNRNITFLDTPGHEAFTAMRARGAQVTDIAILVVAADDGVMPQTVEAINHAKAAKVSIIVAINKIDKPGANPDRVKQQLTEHGLVVEEWGGDVISVPVSAKKNMNIDHLLEMVLLTADILELKANPNRQAKGTVIEAKLDKDKGPIATVLVQRGTLKVGDSIVTGTVVGRIRAMVDDKGHKIKKAGPSTPAEILGLPEVPEAGEIFYAITDEKVAKQLAEKRRLAQREQQLKASARVSLEDLFNQIKEGKVKDLNIIVKADVQGSVEAVKQSLEKLTNDEVRVNIIHGGVGAVTESDITLAEVSNAIIIGFNVRPGANVADLAKDAGVDMRLYRVIYNAIEDIEAAMKGMLEPTFKEVVQGHAEVRQIFRVSGVGTIGGCYVTDGKITRNSDIRVVRNGIVVFEGKLASLKRFKDDVKEVTQGFECGLSVEKFNDIKETDVIESFAMEEVAR